MRVINENRQITINASYRELAVIATALSHSIVSGISKDQDLIEELRKLHYTLCNPELRTEGSQNAAQ
ncbi:hypothetical protein MHI02_05645 [Oceanobacillus sp. FSL K6-0118]|uniref:hypothetical protein n=1 Tax=Oceanobacillus sp. FSL K6-0118 TaxID=2921418 RepID=UPI0030F8B8D9